MAKWHHLTDDPNGGSTGEAFSSTLNNNQFSLAHRLARESLQNSRDAVANGKKLSAEFRFLNLKGSAKKNLVDSLDLTTISDRKEELGIKKETCLDHLNDSSPLRLLFVSDSNTTGLYGNPRASASHLRRFLLTLGDRKKQREGAFSGGSYGFGKAVYSASSRIRTVVAYSRFDENADKGINTRLMGCGYFRPYSKRGHDYSGRAIFGTPAKDDADRRIIDPLTNSDAHNLAKKLGFSVREEGQSGSTILVLDPQVTAEDLVMGIETWWWPALVEQSMDVAVYDEGGERLIPKPKQRTDLRPFIGAFEIATGAAEPVGAHEARPSFNRVDDVSIGSAGFVLLDSEAIEKGFPEERANCVALIRAPRMVVDYHPIGGLSPFLVGTFVASDDVELWLKVSEPPAHDVWDASSPDLDEYGDTAHKAVKAIHNRLKTQSAAFRKSAMPRPGQSQRSLKVFENMFGRMFKSKQPGQPPIPPGDSAPIHIEFVDHPMPNAVPNRPDRIQFKTRFDVRLKDDYAKADADLRVALNCSIVEEEDSRGDALAIAATYKGPKHAQDAEGNYIFTLKKGAKASFEVESEPYDSVWSVIFTPVVNVLTRDEK